MYLAIGSMPASQKVSFPDFLECYSASITEPGNHYISVLPCNFNLADLVPDTNFLILGKQIDYLPEKLSMMSHFLQKKYD
jgi:hypothetical protein